VDNFWRNVLLVGIDNMFVVRGFDIALARHQSFYPLSSGSLSTVGGTRLGVRLFHLSFRLLAAVACVNYYFAFVFRSSLPDVLGRLGFDKKVRSDVTAKIQVLLWRAATVSSRSLLGIDEGYERGGAARSEAQEKEKGSRE